MPREWLRFEELFHVHNSFLSRIYVETRGSSCPHAASLFLWRLATWRISKGPLAGLGKWREVKGKGEGRGRESEGAMARTGVDGKGLNDTISTQYVISEADRWEKRKGKKKELWLYTASSFYSRSVENQLHSISQLVISDIQRSWCSTNLGYTAQYDNYNLKSHRRCSNMSCMNLGGYVRTRDYI